MFSKFNCLFVAAFIVALVASDPVPDSKDRRNDNGHSNQLIDNKDHGTQHGNNDQGRAAVRRRCQVPDTPARANVLSPVDAPSVGDMVDDGFEITYACDNGQDTVGQPTIQCADSEWEPNEMPSCPIQDRSCRKPDLAGGVKIVEGQRDRYQDGQSISFQCPRGYYLDGAPSMTCNNGQWSDSAPDCMRN